MCVGDCNSDGQVTVDEIITMVNVALGNSAVTTGRSPLMRSSQQ
jgi:hypothetical protein